MTFPTKDGKKKSSKFKASRYDREHASDSEPKGESEAESEKESAGGGARAMANRMQGKKQGNPETAATEMPASMSSDDSEMAPMGEEQAEEAVHPGIHEEIKGVMAEHGPAHTVHMTHDDDRQSSHVHSIHADGHEHHADHQGEGHRMHAHQHADHASGVPIKEDGAKEHEPEHEHGGMDDEESYGEPL